MQKSQKSALAPFLSLLLADPSDELVSSVLQRLRDLPPDERFSDTQWQLLVDKQPNIARFIQACSYEMAPNDPAARGQIATAMLGLCVLLGEAKLREDINQTFGKSLTTYFST